MAVFSRSNILPEGVDNSWSWFLCILAALCNALHFGVSLSFGVLFPYLLEHFTESIDITAMVGSLAIAITFVATFPAAKLVDYFGLRAVTFSGAVICIVSLIATSFAQNLISVFFTYSIGFGIGASFLYTSSMFISSKYFKGHRNVALGIICAGGGAGYLVFGPVLQLMLDKFGWKLTCRYMGIVFVIPAIIAFFYGSNTQNEQRKEEEEADNEPLHDVPSKKVFHWSILKNSSYTVNVASMTLAGLAHYVPQIYLVS
ncbi:hypothetical protein QZH41_008473 [Actinostola sp. cb2023]|nr:hypothetical protein QZH41_008473 [Actinostola sp. cb2023]